MAEAEQVFAGPPGFAPLTGYSAGRRFFLHGGRTDDLLTAIDAHSSAAADCNNGDSQVRSPCYGQSEATAVIGAFEALPPGDQQAILDFLRSL